jgi:predicted transposase/invertase (TIGR01784 family)
MSTQEYIDSFVVLSKTELSKLSQKDRIAYQDSLKYYRDLHNSLNYAREEGKQTGEKQKVTEIAKKSILENLSFDIISTITGLSIDEIQKIANSLKK